MILGKGSSLPVMLNLNKIKTRESQNKIKTRESQNKIKTRESQKVMLLGLTIDNCLTFKDLIYTFIYYS